MAEFDEDRILEISVRITAAFLDFHHLDLRPSRSGSAAWTLTLGSTEYLGRPGFELPGPDEVGGFPARTIALTSERVGPILRGLSRLVLPTSPPSTGGLDGYAFAVKFQRFHSHAEFNWWGEVPPVWEPLGRIVDDLLALADEPGWPRSRGGWSWSA
jgi:hypothetical protein